MNAPADKAADILRSGGVIAYPTEGVFGLGCLPDNLDAIERILQIKQRDSAKGLILIAADASQLDRFVDLPESAYFPEPQADNPITWIVPAGNSVSPALRGDNDGIAVRITTHPVAQSICRSVESAIVSTSANKSGQPVARNQTSLVRQFGSLVDYVVPGACGPSDGPSEIRDLQSGEVLRAR
jgi:L-threonylcarbamoyladenylate synthase